MEIITYQQFKEEVSLDNRKESSNILCSIAETAPQYTISFQSIEELEQMVLEVRALMGHNMTKLAKEFGDKEGVEVLETGLLINADKVSPEEVQSLIEETSRITTEVLDSVPFVEVKNNVTNE